MSWWDRYLAPGDLRARQRLQSSSSDEASDEAKPAAPTPPPRIDASKRAQRQNGLFFGGIAFTIATVIVTRRAIQRKTLATFPHLAATAPKTTNPNPNQSLPHFTQSHGDAKVEGSLDAAQGLILATLNVAAIFMAGIGGFMKAFDVADLEDLRDFVRTGIGYDVYSGESEADKELEDWVANVLSKKDGSLDLSQGSLVNMVAEMEGFQKLKKEAEQSSANSKDGK